MKVGDWIDTPRFCKVEIEQVFEDRREAYKNGFTEPTHYRSDPEWDVLGKSIDMCHMTFAAVRK